MGGILISLGITAVAQRGEPLPLRELQQFANVFAAIKNTYVEPLTDQALVNNAIKGLFTDLDPHSAYLDADAFKEMEAMTQGGFGGLGIEIGSEDGMPKVISPIEDTPAARAGILAGDIITHINGKPTKDLSLNDAVKRMRGEPNTKVTLTILRKDESRSFPVTITRTEIKTQSVKAKMIEPGYGWVRVSQFQERTVDDFVRKVEDLYKQDPNLKGLVLDLRNDPGGLLDAAVAISAAFLQPNVTVVTTDGQLAESKAIFRASPEFYARRGSDPIKSLPAAIKNIPLVVLVNEGSASASEIVSGALQDHKRATIMGAQTFGKGSVQTVRPLGPDTGIKLTTARYYTPSGKSIQAKGIVPDIMVDESAEGDLFAALRTREADLEKHLSSGQGPEVKDEAREKAREAALKRLDEESKKPASERRPPEFGSDKDFQLQQALHQLKGEPVQVSQTKTERPAEKKDEEKTSASDKPAESNTDDTKLPPATEPKK